MLRSMYSHALTITVAATAISILQHVLQAQARARCAPRVSEALVAGGLKPATQCVGAGVPSPGTTPTSASHLGAHDR